MSQEIRSLISIPPEILVNIIVFSNGDAGLMRSCTYFKKLYHTLKDDPLVCARVMCNRMVTVTPMPWDMNDCHNSLGKMKTHFRNIFLESLLSLLSDDKEYANVYLAYFRQLLWACVCEEMELIETIQVLFRCGAPDVHAGEQLTRAVLHGKTEIVHQLFSGGARCDKALSFAAWCDHKEIVSLLLRGGVDVHFRNDQALRCAVVTGRTEIVRMLLNAGADLHTLDEDDVEKVQQMLLNRGSE